VDFFFLRIVNIGAENNVDIETLVNRDSTTSTFLFLGFLDESQDHTV